MDDIEKRLQNTEKALMALFTVLQPLQPPATQDDIYHIMEDYFEANISLGFDGSSSEFMR